MKLNTLILSSSILGSAILGSVFASSVQADSLRQTQRHSFQTEVNRSVGERNMHRYTEQVASKHQFQRSTNVTTGAGKTASRQVQGNYDEATKTYTRSMESTRPNGDTVSSLRETSKTDDGFVRSQTRTNAEGQVASKEVNVSMDYENKVQTRNVEATGYDGKTYSASVTRSFDQGGDE